MIELTAEDIEDQELIDRTMELFAKLLGLAALKANKPGAVVLTIIDLMAAEGLLMHNRLYGTDTDFLLAKHIEHVRMALETKRAREH